MKLTMFRAMGLGVLFAAVFLAWLEIDLTLRGAGSFRDTFWFTLFSLIAIAIFSLLVLRSPDNG
ncbi:MAG: hypothetical protein QW514_07475 [Thermoprotei archaeon]